MFHFSSEVANELSLTEKGDYPSLDWFGEFPQLWTQSSFFYSKSTFSFFSILKREGICAIVSELPALAITESAAGVPYSGEMPLPGSKRGKKPLSLKYISLEVSIKSVVVNASFDPNTL